MRLRRPAPPPLASACALFLDADGTLLELAATPDQVQMPPFLPGLLLETAALLSGALAVVSGRSRAQLALLFGEATCHLVGQHGLDTEDGLAPGVAVADTTALVAKANRIALRFPGALVEDKTIAVALHWRGNTDAEAHFVRFAHDEVRALPGYQVQAGHRVVELRPSGGKGDAVSRLMETPAFRGRQPVFVGDDSTDEAGFQAVQCRGGIGIVVGERRESAARFALPDVASVIAWLRAAHLSHDTASTRTELATMPGPRPT